MEECNENIDEEKIIETILFERKNEYTCYCTVFVILTVRALAINIGMGAYFIYYTYMNRNK